MKLESRLGVGATTKQRQRLSKHTTGTAGQRTTQTRKSRKRAETAEATAERTRKHCRANQDALAVLAARVLGQVASNRDHTRTQRSQVMVSPWAKLSSTSDFVAPPKRRKPKMPKNLARRRNDEKRGSSERHTGGKRTPREQTRGEEQRHAELLFVTPTNKVGVLLEQAAIQAWSGSTRQHTRARAPKPHRTGNRSLRAGLRRDERPTHM